MNIEKSNIQCDVSLKKNKFENKHGQIMNIQAKILHVVKAEKEGGHGAIMRRGAIFTGNTVELIWFKLYGWRDSVVEISEISSDPSFV